MVLTFHIFVALFGLFSALGATFKPSKGLISLSVVSIVSTLTTGAVLVLQGGSLLHVCITGLVYAALAGALTVIGSVRLRQLVVATNYSK